LEAVAFGIPVNAFEMEVCAWVKLRSENEPTTTVDELKEFCKDYLVEFKIPKYMKLVKEIPTSRMSKYLRREMQEQYKAELGL
jgi:acyl-CoA synthetase (AMP-forming)/AMP-acid ligase II